jgi:hypothetical protein
MKSEIEIAEMHDIGHGDLGDIDNRVQLDSTATRLNTTHNRISHHLSSLDFTDDY